MCTCWFRRGMHVVSSRSEAWLRRESQWREYKMSVRSSPSPRRVVTLAVVGLALQPPRHLRGGRSPFKMKRGGLPRQPPTSRRPAVAALPPTGRGCCPSWSPISSPSQRVDVQDGLGGLSSRSSAAA